MSKKKTAVKTIFWKGSAGIEEANNLKTELVESFKNNSNISLDLSKLEDIDITGIQLIIAAKKEAEQTNKIFSLCDTIPESISTFTSAAGISLSSFIIPQSIQEPTNA